MAHKTIDSTILKSNAHQKLATLNPGTIAEANSISIAFITKVNSPKVKMFIGNVSKIKIGRINALIMPITKAATNADQNPVIVTPGKIYAVAIIARVIIIQFIIIVIAINNTPETINNFLEVGAY